MDVRLDNRWDVPNRFVARGIWFDWVKCHIVLTERSEEIKLDYYFDEVGSETCELSAYTYKNLIFLLRTSSPYYVTHIF